MRNPLLEADGLPDFATIRPEHVEPAIDLILLENRVAIDALLKQSRPFTWTNLVEPLEALGQDRPVVFYVHPREIDPGHPRMEMPAVRRFKSYVNLRTTEPKIRGVLKDFPVAPFIDFIRADASLSGVLQ